MLRSFAAATMLFASCCATQASETIFYGTRIGMEVTVMKKTGIGTSKAVIRTRHTRENATAFCRDYVGHVTEKCIRDELSAPLKNKLRANCRTGEFTDFYGNRYRLLGPNPDKAGPTRYQLKALETGEIADGSMASGYPINMRILEALCPKIAAEPF